MVTEADVKAKLSLVAGPDRTGDLISLGLVEGLSLRGDRVTFVIRVPAERARELEPMRRAAEQVVGELPGIAGVTAVLTAERAPGAAPEPPRLKPAAARKAPPHGGLKPKAPIEGVGRVIAVASGKGGVGKSTTAVNLALALQAEGHRVGILDADIYGPSLPRMLGAADRPETVEKRMKPVEAQGLQVMSMGFLVDEAAPMVWRGPMVMSALTQMMREVDWGPLDILVVDMPPGTGDAQLTLCQSVPLAGAVIVSTPQDIALIDARKGLNMFRKVEVPVLGIVENMSYFLCPSCGDRSDIFGHGGAREEAEKLGIPFLGEVPLHMEIRRNSDQGTPVVASAPEGPHAGAYRAIAREVLAGLETVAVTA
ncbi:iron-sulfur cluster carrier protein ApbC [Mangrovicoccus algicola]|uniref:Iron-sulfur cluster carrier protein n=1 Tax=Mangrovicoccus algicola TaxID=2771008 RepID=A0A8J7CIB0_9RHOB|nr:iron-sulfur cluster carrier protein ApbC [Mangrovicoccus algicola]MBE3639360.1 iron-sulfur cluster carrier protein ApbC [Mangrovicoccus algicola]